MKKTMKVLLLVSLLFILVSGLAVKIKEQRSIIQPNHISAEKRKSDIQDAFSIWKSEYLRQIAGSQYYVAYDTHQNTVSEAHGYGMLIMVMMEGQFDVETKPFFDGMFRYAKDHPSDGNPSLMVWRQFRQEDGTMKDDQNGEFTGSATDGDMDIAYALLLADQLWGSGGTINYKQEAVEIIDALMKSVVNQEEWILKLGDWVKDDDPKYGTASRTSDWMLGHMALFYEATGDERWEIVSDKTIELITRIQNQYSPETGLLPDFVWKQGEEWSPVYPNFLEGETDPYYSYNAARVPWRLAAGYMLIKDQEVKNQLEKINSWIIEAAKSDPALIKAGYNLDGQSLVTYSDMVFTAPFAASASVSSKHQDWLNLLWENMSEEPRSQKTSNYYNDTIRLLVMLYIEETEKR